MRLLLDTQILYWWFYDTKKLPPRSVDIIRAAEAVFVSSASLWEISIKVRLGKMQGDTESINARIEENDFVELPVLFRHSAVVATLSLHHADPFDRLLIAQAISEPLRLLTVDPELSRYTELFGYCRYRPLR